jgi:hypothetical protein
MVKADGVVAVWERADEAEEAQLVAAAITAAM